jgi:hypothetical protein
VQKTSTSGLIFLDNTRLRTAAHEFGILLEFLDDAFENDMPVAFFEPAQRFGNGAGFPGTG